MDLSEFHYRRLYPQLGWATEIECPGCTLARRSLLHGPTVDCLNKQCGERQAMPCANSRSWMDKAGMTISTYRVWKNVGYYNKREQSFCPRWMASILVGTRRVLPASSRLSTCRNNASRAFLMTSSSVDEDSEHSGKSGNTPLYPPSLSLHCCYKNRRLDLSFQVSSPWHCAL